MIAKSPSPSDSLFYKAAPVWFQGLYFFAYAVFCLIYLPHFILRTKRAENPKRVIHERLGNYGAEKSKIVEGRKVIWIHAVSVGEVMACRVLIEQLLSLSSEIGIVLTTVTPTGQSIAKQYENERLVAAYIPFDFAGLIQKFIRAFRPQLLLLMETELWPQAILESRSHHIPVGMINARLSEKSLRRYRRFQGIFRFVFENLNFVLAQTAEDAQRFQKLRIPSEKIQVLGNMKFDSVSLEKIPEEFLNIYKEKWQINSLNKIWVVGSTHPGEEEIVFRVFESLKKNFPYLKCILAPRHIERAPAIQKQAEAAGLRVSFSKDSSVAADWDILILNELGILKQIYGLADVVYVGGSLIPHGGQNPIEPAALKKPILHGPNIFNFKVIYGELNTNQAALLVRDESALKQQLTTLLKDSNACQRLGENAFRFVQSTQGASQRHAEWILNLLTLPNSERILCRAL